MNAGAKADVLLVAKQAGKLVLLALGSFVLCFGIAIAVFWLFYEINGYDRDFGEGSKLEAFKFWFWFSFAVWLSFTAAASILLSRILRASLLPSLIVIGIAMAPFTYVLLALLTFMNFCGGINSFPFPTGETGC